MKIGHKLKLNSLVVLVLLTVIIAVAIFSISRIQKDVRQLVEVEEPLEQAILEMEINAGETARAVLHYVWNPEERDIARMRDSERDFERYAREFERLAETEEERVLGREVGEIYREFKTLGAEITALTRQRNAALQTYIANIEELDELFDKSFKISIDLSSSHAIEKTRAASLMDEVLDGSVGKVGRYVAHASPALRQEIIEAEVNFKRYLARYRATPLSADEERWLVQIDKGFGEIAKVGKGIVALTDAMHEKLGRFRDDLERIDRILDDEIQVLIQEETRRAAKDARDSGEKAIAIIAFVGLMIFGSMAGANWFVSRGIVDGVNRLSEGAMEFGRGNLDHRVEVQTKDELGVLADAFNLMADRRKSDDAMLKRRAQEALSESEQRLRAILDNALDAIVTIDEHGLVETFNHAAERTFGYTAEEVIGHNVNMLMAEPERTEHDEYIGRYLRTGKAAIIGKGREVTGRRKDGATFQLDLGIVEVAQGERRMFIGTLHDLTQQKRIEAQLRQAQKLEALGWLAGGIAHDFNNILLPIITITEVCRDDLPADGELSGHLAKVLLAAQRGRALVDQILKFSRRQPLDRRSVDLREVVEEALKLARATVPSMIEISLHFDAAVGKVLADSNQIHESVVNLITNAAYAIGTKKGIIEVALREARISDSADGVPVELEPGTYARLTISDTGAGMEEETLAHIFDPFFTTKPFGEGTGMGLAAVHGIVTGHGGAIAVSSQPHIGTSFEIYLPVIEMAATAPSDAEATEETV